MTTGNTKKTTESNGVLYNATKIFKDYDPEADPADYKYSNFGYFLIMDEEWHRRRLRIGFDLDNT